MIIVKTKQRTEEFNNIVAAYRLFRALDALGIKAELIDTSVEIVTVTID